MSDAKLDIEDADTPDEIVQCLLDGQRFEFGEGWMRTLDQMADERDQQLADGDSRGLSAQERIKTAAIAYLYGTADPKKVPIEYIRHALRHPIGIVFPEQKYRDRIDGPIKAIRAFCVECESDIPGVRNCGVSNCPLWPFRMGKNPFYGKFEEGNDESDDFTFDEELTDVTS